ncbi:unnamed protein product [Symbiodinium natans]|uniref:Uncharacterized protein n=1 Tax=Symbiodinium natans TaxID=878477 RepID=A0A812R612_9DINO|nr:unnamed protein product [Symbiodinium natans]
MRVQRMFGWIALVSSMAMLCIVVTSSLLGEGRSFLLAAIMLQLPESQVSDKLFDGNESNEPSQFGTGLKQLSHSSASAELKSEPFIAKRHVAAIMLAMQRSGTSFLALELNRHPCINMQSELFIHGSWTPELRKDALEIFFRADMNVSELGMFPSTAQEVLVHSARAFREGAVARGFNWKLNQEFVPCWHSWLGDWVAKHGVRLIWVQRLNMLRRIFSNEANKRNKLAVTTNKSLAKLAGAMKISINTSTILQDLAREEQNLKAVRRILADARRKGVRVHTVFYENMTDSIGAVRNFLLHDSPCTSHAKMPLKQYPGYQKLHVGKFRDVVENWNQLRNTLRRTSWEWMLSR